MQSKRRKHTRQRTLILGQVVAYVKRLDGKHQLQCSPIFYIALTGNKRHGLKMTEEQSVIIDRHLPTLHSSPNISRWTRIDSRI
jgi:hypothetical protein